MRCWYSFVSLPDGPMFKTPFPVESIWGININVYIYIYYIYIYVCMYKLSYQRPPFSWSIFLLILAEPLHWSLARSHIPRSTGSTVGITGIFQRRQRWPWSQNLSPAKNPRSVGWRRTGASHSCIMGVLLEGWNSRCSWKIFQEKNQDFFTRHRLEMLWTSNIGVLVIAVLFEFVKSAKVICDQAYNLSPTNSERQILVNGCSRSGLICFFKFVWCDFVCETMT